MNVNPFNITTATAQEVRDESARRQECRNRKLPFSGPNTLPHNWKDTPMDAPLLETQTRHMKHRAPDDVTAHAVESGVRLVTLPWECLAPDNTRFVAVKSRNGAPKLLMRKMYREAKKRAGETVKSQVGDQPPLTMKLELRAVFYEPNRHRRDLSNYIKLVHDAMSGLVYEDDSQLSDVHWVRGGIDKEAPRVEITVREVFWPKP